MLVSCEIRCCESYRFLSTVLGWWVGMAEIACFVGFSLRQSAQQGGLRSMDVRLQTMAGTASWAMLVGAYYK